VSAAMGASGSKAVLLCELWCLAILAGVHRVVFGCVLLHVVGFGFTDWIVGSVVISSVIVGSVIIGNIIVISVSMVLGLI